MIFAKIKKMIQSGSSELLPTEDNLTEISRKEGDYSQISCYPSEDIPEKIWVERDATDELRAAVDYLTQKRIQE